MSKRVLGALESGGAETITSSWFWFEAVHEVRVSPSAQLDCSLNQPEGSKGKSFSRKGWALGLLRVTQGAWCALGCQLEEVQERRVLLAKITSEEYYAKHVANDHVPYLKGCPTYIRAQGRRRSHWRS